MSPEQAAGQPSTSASDYYALGVMMFEALLGRVPFSGNVLQILAAKQREDAPHPKVIVPELPDDLCALCFELLARDPHKRPQLDAIRERLGAHPYVSTHSDASLMLVDRVEELRQLQDAFEAALSGETVIVVIVGESGIGKSSLCDHFIRKLRLVGSMIVVFGERRNREAAAPTRRHRLEAPAEDERELPLE